MFFRKLAFFHNGVFAAAGTEQVTLRLAEWFVSHGHEVYIIAQCFSAEVASYDILNRVKCLTMSYRDARNADTRARFLTDCCRRYGIDVVLMMGGYLRTLGKVAGKVDSHLIYCCHNKPFWETDISLVQWDMKHSSGLWGRSFAGRLWRKAKRCIVKRRTMRRYRYTWRSVDRYVVLCNAYLDEVRAALGIDPSADTRTVAMYNPCDNMPCATVSDRNRRLLFVGRLVNMHKRVDRVLAAWRQLQTQFPEWSLDIVGDGEDRAELEDMARSYDLQRVTFHGWQTDLDRYYDDAAVLLMTSSYEGWPLVVIEAQQRGVIPVVFDCASGVHEMVEAGGGVLVPAFDMEAYVGTLRDLMSSSHRRRELSARVLCTRNIYDHDRIGAEWERLFGSLGGR